MLIAKYTVELGANLNESGFHCHLHLFISICEDSVGGLWEVHPVGDGTPREEMQRDRGDAGGHLGAAPSSIRLGQGLLKSWR